MENIAKKIIPIGALIIFIIIMTTASILKQPFYGTDDVMYYVDQLSDDIRNERWDMAHNQLDETKNAWKHVVYRIQFSTERDEINNFKKNLEHIRGFIMAEDQAGALANISEMRFIWKELGK